MNRRGSFLRRIGGALILAAAAFLLVGQGGTIDWWTMRQHIDQIYQWCTDAEHPALLGLLGLAIFSAGLVSGRGRRG